MGQTTIQRAVALAGGQGALAAALGVRQPAVSRWASKGYFPPKRWAKVSKVTGLSVAEIASDYMRVVIRGEAA